MSVKNFITVLRGMVNLNGSKEVSEAVSGNIDTSPIEINTTKYKWSDMNRVMKNSLPLDNTTILPLDTHYWVPEAQTYHSAISHFKNNGGNDIYQGDAKDCEDYALDMMNFFQNQCGINSVGFVYDGDSQHSYNVVIYNDADGLRATLFEPNFWSLEGGEVEATERDGKYSVHTSTVLL